jgi:hypothetical protein
MVYAQIYSIVQNLVSWGLGSVCNPITLCSVYQVHADAPTSVHAHVAAMFASTFPVDGFLAELMLTAGNSSTETSSQASTQTQTSAQTQQGGVVMLNGHSQSSSCALLHRVLSVFDGKRDVAQVAMLLPLDLQPLVLDMIVWLLRYVRVL